MDREHIFGMMVINMKDNGKIIKDKEQVYSIGLMEIYMTDNGWMIKEMD